MHVNYAPLKLETNQWELLAWKVVSLETRALYLKPINQNLLVHKCRICIKQNKNIQIRMPSKRKEK